MTGLRGVRGPSLIGLRTLATLMCVLCLMAACGSPGATMAPSSGTGGDPRSSGQGPGLVGDPLVAIGAVVAIGVGAVILTLAYVRMTSRRDG